MTRTSLRILTILALALGALTFAAVSSAGEGDRHDHGEHHQKGEHKSDGHHTKAEHSGNVWRYSTTLTSADTGTCGQNVWANEVINRTYTVRKSDSGVYTMTAFDRGTFTTVAGASPGSCESGTDHGTVVTAGITGRMGGFISGQVLGGTFNPNATCTATNCFRADFLAAFFGSTAKFSCDTDQACKYLFGYHSTDPALKYRFWLDRGTAKDGVLKAVDRGDIATA